MHEPYQDYVSFNTQVHRQSIHNMPYNKNQINDTIFGRTKVIQYGTRVYLLSLIEIVL